MLSHTSILEKNGVQRILGINGVIHFSAGLTKRFCTFFFYSEADLKESSNKVKSNKSRSSFSVAQVLHLERVFDRQKYLGSRDRQKIAEQLQMTEAQVTQWHQ